MKILHVADLHRRWFEFVRARATEFDLLVVAGDITDAFSDLSMAQQAREASAWLLSLATPTVVVSGNHDFYRKSARVAADPHAEALWLRQLSGRGRIIATDGESVAFQAAYPPVRITALGWSQEPLWPPETDILVAHAPPCGVDVAVELGGTRDLGDSALWHALQRAARRPRLILSGHVHLPRSTWARWPAGSSEANTTILIPGCDESAPEPQRWEIDLSRNRATWFGERETVIEI